MVEAILAKVTAACHGRGRATGSREDSAVRAGLDPSLLRHHIVLVFRTCARNLLQACMTVGELVVSLLLDGDTSCHACSLMLIRQCAQHFTASFYVYAAPRASAYEKLGGTTLPASIKEAAVNKVVSGEKATLEDAVEGMGYTRKCAATIFLDFWTDLLASSRSLASSRCYIVLCYATGPRQCTHVPQPRGVQQQQLPAGTSVAS